eukprot:634666-Rhodomonas_salina.3
MLGTDISHAGTEYEDQGQDDLAVQSQAQDQGMGQPGSGIQISARQLCYQDLAEQQACWLPDWKERVNDTFVPSSNWQQSAGSLPFLLCYASVPATDMGCAASRSAEPTSPFLGRSTASC